jgi:putative tricarboxylic transport membrane protein
VPDGVQLSDASGQRRWIRNPRDFWGCSALAGLALVSLWINRDLPGMDGPLFGPGTAPRIFAVCLLLLSGTVAAWAAFTSGEAPGRFHIRGMVVVTISVLVFALMIRPFGLVVTTFVSFMIAALGTSETRWFEVTIAAVAFTAGSVLLFVYGLSLQFSILPRFMQ